MLNDEEEARLKAFLSGLSHLDWLWTHGISLCKGIAAWAGGIAAFALLVRWLANGGVLQ